jgi:hypothetical protein
MGLPLIGKLLGHASTQSTERYAHLQRNPARRATEEIGRQLARALGESPEEIDQPTDLELPIFLKASRRTAV